MIALTKVLDVRPVGAARLWLRFSDLREGTCDLSDLLAEDGPMALPLRDPAMFDRAFVQFGVVTWPNGFDLDSIALYRKMDEDGLLSSPLAA